MKQHDCSCAACTPPRPSHGWLLPRIIAKGKEWLRRQCFSLQIDHLPACAQSPYTLISVSPCGEPTWEPLADGRPLCFRVRIPLVCQVRDGCGCLHSGSACISLNASLTPLCPPHECWRSCMMVLPCVRLVCSACSQTCCIDAQLEVLLEAYLLRWESCMASQPCKPKCPDLPLYPQPCRM